MASFSIEVPAETNPLSERTLLQALEAAASIKQGSIQTGTKQLEQWHSQAGFYPLLQTAFMEKTLSTDVRLVAIIQIKNGIDKYWRRTALNAVSKADKDRIRQNILTSGINEEDRILAVQNAVAAAKIIRYEFQTEWPRAVPQIAEALRAAASPNSNPVHLPRVMLILLHVVKELSSGGLLRTREYLHGVTPELVRILGGIYLERVQTWLDKSLDTDNRETMEQSLLALKILRRLAIAGYSHPNRDADMQGFWRVLRLHINQMISKVPPSGQQQPLTQNLLEKHLMQIAKLHLSMANEHPAAFALLPDSLELLRAYWQAIADYGGTFQSLPEDLWDETPLMEKLCLKGMLLIRQCLKMVSRPSDTFKSLRMKQQQDKEEETQATSLIRDFCSVQFVHEALEVLVSRYLRLRPKDLQEWQDEPEEWEHREEGEGDSYEFILRPCAERLFLEIVSSWKDSAMGHLLGVFQTYGCTENRDAATKEAVYNAIGLAAAVLNTQISFESLIRTVLVYEIQDTDPSYKILRRRIAILTSQWMPVQVPQEVRPAVYQMFQHLLEPSQELNDIVVRIVAGKKLGVVVDEIEFQPEPFMPYAGTLLERLALLIREVKETDTLVVLMGTLISIVERLENRAGAFTTPITAVVSHVWTVAQTEHMLASTTFELLTTLFEAMRGDSQALQADVLPIIRDAVTPGSPAYEYLYEDGLQLWRTVLRQCDVPSGGLSASTPHMQRLAELSQLLPAILSANAEHLGMALEITGEYFVLDTNYLLSQQALYPIFKELAALLGTLRLQLNAKLVSTVEIILLCIYESKQNSATSHVQAAFEAFVASGFLPNLLQILHECHTAHQTTGPNARSPPVEMAAETDYFTIVSRICLLDPASAVQVMQSACGSSSLQDLLPWFLEEWFSCFENIGEKEAVKLNCLAITYILQPQNYPFVLNRLQDYLNMWTTVITQMRQPDVQVINQDGDTLPVDYDAVQDAYAQTRAQLEASSSATESPEDRRKRRLTEHDPIYVFKARTFVGHALRGTISDVGGPDAFQQQWLVNVDQDIVKGFGELGLLQ